MKYVVSLYPNPDSSIRIQGEGDSLPKAIYAFVAAADDYGSDDLKIDVGRGLGQLQIAAAEVQEAIPVQIVDGRLENKL